jgi:protein gp37
MSRSNIEWTSATWNPVVGCTRVSPGCDNCYAVRDSWRQENAAKAAERR